MQKLELSDGTFALVDDKDYHLVSKYKWWYDKGVGVQGWVEGKQVLLHRFLFNETKTTNKIDHRDRNKRNNLRTNLRYATWSQNNCNRGSWNPNGYKGISKRDNGKWVSKIKIRGRSIHVGYFNSALEAAIAYNKAAKKYHGEFACLNVLRFPRLKNGIHS